MMWRCLQIPLMVVNTPQKQSYPVIFAQSGKRIEASYLLKQPKHKGSLHFQLTELSTNEMLISLFPNISTLVKICLAITIGTASVERSFSQVKLIKTRLRNRIGQSSLLYLMKIAIKTPEKLTDEDLNNIVNVCMEQKI